MIAVNSDILPGNIDLIDYQIGVFANLMAAEMI
jgi:hypothetical protein